MNLDEIKKLANATKNLRDRCFILLLYETGCRIGELIGDNKYPGIRVGDIKFDKYGAIVDVDGKTGQRNLRVISAAPAISNWKNQHPNKDEKDFNQAYLFCGIHTKRGQKIEYRYWNKLF